MSSKTINRDRAARHLAVFSATHPNTQLGKRCATLVAGIDAGTVRGLGAAVQQLVDDGWKGAARRIASAHGSRATRGAVSELRDVAELERKLGLAPTETDAASEPETEAASEPETDPDQSAESDPEPRTEWSAA